MSVLQTHVIKDVNQCSPSVGDVERVVDYGKDGEELISYKPIDYPKLCSSHGVVDMWSLDNMLKAGINPNSSIHTGLNSRLDGVSAVNEFDSSAEKIISENSNDKVTE